MSLRLNALLILVAITCVAQTPGEPVIVGGQVVLRIQERLGPFTATDRAHAASDRLNSLSKDLSFDLSTVQAVDLDSLAEIVAGDRVLLTITAADAAASGIGAHEAALIAAQKIRDAIKSHRAAYSSRSLLFGGLWTAGATALLLLLFWLFKRGLRSIHKHLEMPGGKRIPPVRIQTVELLSGERLRTSLIQTANLIRILLVALLLYIYIPLELSFFPWTQEYAPVLFNFFLQPLHAAVGAFVAYLPKLAIVILCCAGAYLVSRFSRFLFAEVGAGTLQWNGFYREWAKPSDKLVRFLIIAFTAVVIFPYLPGSDSPGFKGISIFLGLLLSLGSSSAVSNIIGGVILTYSRAFHVGDRVKVGDTVGDIVEKTLLVTRIRTTKNEEITVPNSMVLSSHIINYSSNAQGPGLILHTSVTIGYDAPWRTVHQLLIDAALKTAAIENVPQPFVLQTSLDDFFVSYQINAYTKQANQMAGIYSELHQNIQDRFNEAGVEIMSPHYAALRDGNRTAIPDSYLPRK